MRLPVVTPSQREHVQHRHVALVLELRRVDQMALRIAARPGRDRQILLAVDLERHRRRREGGADIDLPELVQRGVVESRDGAVEQPDEDEAAGGRERAAVVRVGQMDGFLDRAGDRIDGDQVALVALGRRVRAADPLLALDERLVVVEHGLAGGHGRDVDEPRLGAVGGRPVIVAAVVRWAKLLERRARDQVADARIGLDVLAWVIVERLAGLLIEALGPIDVVHIGLGDDDLAVVAVHRIEEAVAGRMGDELARLAVDRAVDENVGPDLVEVPGIAGRVLEVPVHLAGIGIPRDRAVGEEVIARPHGRIVFRHRIAGAPDRLVGRQVISAGHPERAASGLPGIGLVLPGLAAGLAGRRHGELAPRELTGRSIDRRDPFAHARGAPGRAEDELVLDGERRGPQARIRLAELHIGLPGHLPGILVGGDDARRLVGDRDDEIAPERDPAIGGLLLLLGVHAPDDAADVARRAVDLVDHAPGIDGVEKAVLGERRRLVELVAGRAAERHRVGEFEPLDVPLVDAIERRIALAVIGAVVHQPVLWLGIGEPRGRDLGGKRRCRRDHHAAGEQRVTDRACTFPHHGRSSLLLYRIAFIPGETGPRPIA